jgi:hypothetical protein
MRDRSQPWPSNHARASSARIRLSSALTQTPHEAALKAGAEIHHPVPEAGWHDHVDGSDPHATALRLAELLPQHLLTAAAD